MLPFTYDWRKSYKDSKSIETDLNGFKFKGCGWYITKTDTVLVIQDPASQGYFSVFVWNHATGREDIINEFTKLMAMPVFH